MKARSKRAFRQFVKAFWGGGSANPQGVFTNPTLAKYFVPLSTYPSEEQVEAWGCCRDIEWVEGIQIDNEALTISFTFLSASTPPIKVYDAIVEAGWELEASYDEVCWVGLGDYAEGRDNRIPPDTLATLQDQCFTEGGAKVLWTYSLDKGVDLQAPDAMLRIEAMAEDIEWPHRELDTLMTEVFFHQHASLFRVTQQCPEHCPGSVVCSGGCRCLSFGWPGGWERLARKCRLNLIRLKLRFVDRIALPREMTRLIKDAYMAKVDVIAADLA